ncbi:bifunctional Delta(1)-pyrroline-2-carboxylate/Delta(1)-piperideine-2-carboxylate reductase [Marinimicrococcus flavescens]|uniref:Ornithine cyclodeaminase family protein n=1 Tax=Marinimicrococcus flavescens TaxID=3031815 RepID=A0AAP3XSM7_9PROT|nr:ornithine cyclodeaminase family protein [Marinimicrococcus flavescens]
MSPADRARIARTPRLFDAAAVAAALPYGPLVDRLGEAFRKGAHAPVRHHHGIERPGAVDATLMLMPAWIPGEATGVKLVHVCPGNEKLGLPSVPGLYVLYDGPTGMPQAVLDGTELTVRRTACASALAARHLARADASRLLMVGAGALSAHLVRAHTSVRPIRHVTVWNRTAARAEALVDQLRGEGFEVELARDLEAAAGRADIVSCCTMSSEPVLHGAWLRPGTHVDLVGAFKPVMRESDDEVMRRGTVFVDTFDGAMAEAGDILRAIESGALTREKLAADLALLCRGEHPGRRSEDEITVFKSCGTALEDLAAARMVAESAA